MIITYVDFVNALDLAHNFFQVSLHHKVEQESRVLIRLSPKPTPVSMISHFDGISGVGDHSG